MKPIRPIALAALALLQPAVAEECTRTSGALPATLVELYTSQGCSSCPPAERWLSGFKGAGSVVALEFHVNYWDELGWKDGLADPRFTQRQRALVRASGASYVYTPQVVVGGRDMPSWKNGDAFAREVARIRARPALGAVAVTPRIDRDGIVHAELVATLDARLDPARHELVVALTEDGLVTRVTAGENRGRELAQDFVVRDLWSATLAGPRTSRTVELRKPAQASPRLSVAALIRDLKTGEVVQAVSGAVCE